MKHFSWSREVFLNRPALGPAPVCCSRCFHWSAGKSIAAGYPEEILSIEKFSKGKTKPGTIIAKDNAELGKRN